MTKQPDTPPTLIAWTADLANMAVSLRWGPSIDNPLLVLLTGIPVGATIQCREPFIGTDDTDPDGSDQSVTSGEVIGWSHTQERDALATFCAVMGTPATIEPGYVSVDFNALADAILAAGYHR